MRRAARTRAGTMIILTGEPGIGKTALLRAVVEQASRSGSMGGLGHAEEIDQIAPGAPLLLALRSGPRPLVDGSAFAGLASLYDQQLWLGERISGMLEDAAGRGPVARARRGPGGGRALPGEDAARLLGDLPTARVLHAARQAADNGLLTSGEPGVDSAGTGLPRAMGGRCQPRDRAPG